MSKLIHVPADAGPMIAFPGFGTRLKIDGAVTGGSVAVVEHTLEPGLLGAPPHRHEREDETSYVLEGELTVRVLDETMTVQPGEFVFKPRGSFHAFWNAGNRPLRFLEIISPAGFERYFAELKALVPAQVPPDLGAIAALAARYGVEFDFEAMPRLIQEHGLRRGRS